MRVVSFYTADFEELRQRFCRTIVDDFDIECRQMQVDGIDGTQAGGGSQTWLWKTDLILELIQRHVGQCIIIADIDIQFFGPVRPIVDRELAKADMVFQAEHRDDGVNIGFIALRCTDSVREFWEEVKRRIVEKHEWDQQVVNDMLDSGIDIRWSRFPPSIWNWSQAGTVQDIHLHHANCVKSLRGKLVQMNLVAFTRNLRWFGGLVPYAFIWKQLKRVIRFD